MRFLENPEHDWRKNENNMEQLSLFWGGLLLKIGSF
jgi:hypothetical protein